MTQTVLIVDDEPTLVKALDINLRARGFATVTASSARGAILATSTRAIDLVLLDLGLPDGDGLRVIEGIRGWSGVPIIVLSARHTSDDKVEALDLGADDYVTKPFEMNELLARIRATLRRAAASEDDPVVVAAGEVEIDLTAHQVSRAGAVVKLTPTEYRILELLARRANTLVTQQTLLSEVWGPGYNTQTQYLRVYVAALRRKLEPDPAHPRHLITEPGMGYRLVTE